MKSFDIEFFRFVLIGAVNTFLTYILYAAFLLFSSYAISYTASYVLGIFLSYFLNSVLVFRQPMALGKALQFPLVYVVQYVLGIASLYLLVQVLGVSKLIAPILVLLVTLPVTFVMSRFIIKARPRS